MSDLPPKLTVRFEYGESLLQHIVWNWGFYLLLAISIASCYSAGEAHRHAHRITNICAGELIYDKHGRELK